MPITAPPTIPLITDPSTFSTRAQDWVVWQAEQLYPELVSQSALLGLSLSGTSVTSNAIGVGSKSFTVETSKGFLAGQSIVIARTAASTNRMFGVVTSYNSGTGALVFESQAIEGSGTFTDWSISPTLNAVLTLAQIPNLLITNAKLANAYINDLTLVTALSTDYLPIADSSDSGNKKKALVSDLLTQFASGAEYVTGTDEAKALNSATARAQNLVRGTVINTTSGTSHDITIPSWAKRVSIDLAGVSTSGTAPVILQIGDSGGIEVTGYLGAGSSIGGSAVVTSAYTTGFGFGQTTQAATWVRNGRLVIELLDGFTWCYSAVVGLSDNAQTLVGGGYKSLSAALTTVRLTTTDTFDAGFVSPIWE